MKQKQAKNSGEMMRGLKKRRVGGNTKKEFSWQQKKASLIPADNFFAFDVLLYERSLILQHPPFNSELLDVDAAKCDAKSLPKFLRFGFNRNLDT